MHCHKHDCAPLSVYKRSTKHPFLHSGPQKQQSENFFKTGGSTPTLCLDKAMHAQGAMRQRILGWHTPPCHRRLVITILFSVHANGGHEATKTGFPYAPVSQAHGHNHIVQYYACCTAA